MHQIASGGSSYPCLLHPCPVLIPVPSAKSFQPNIAAVPFVFLGNSPHFQLEPFSRFLSPSSP